MRSLKVLFVVELLASVVPLLEVFRSGYPTNGRIEWIEGWKEGLACDLKAPSYQIATKDNIHI